MDAKQVRAEVAEFFRDTPPPAANRSDDAFAAWWLHRRWNVAPSDAIKVAPGGSYDFGLDAFHLDISEGTPPTLHLIQAKQSASRTELKKAVVGFERTILQLRPMLDGAQGETPIQNEVLVRLAARLDDRRDALRSLRISFEVLHLCETAGESLENYLAPAYERLSDAAMTYLSAYQWSCRTILASEELGPKPNGVAGNPLQSHVLRFAGEPMTVEGNIRYFAGIGYLSDLVDLYRRSGDALFSKNVRLYLYKSAERGPARYMRDTLRSICVASANSPKTSPEQFAILHNGVTLHAKAVDPIDGQLVLRGASVLNGCQTVKNAYLFREEPNIKARLDEDRWRDIRIPLRVLVTTNDELVRRVTVSNNRQTAIRPSAFRANDPVQIELAERFREARIYYERQEQAFVNMQRAQARLIETDYANSPSRPVQMEELAQAIATASERPALSVAAKVSDLFEDSVYKQIFTEEKLADISRLVFIRNVFVAMPLALKDLKGRSQAFDDLPLGKYRYPATRFMTRYIARSHPQLMRRFGETVVGQVGVREPLRRELVRLMSAPNSGFQQTLQELWLDEEENWKSATDAQSITRALQRAALLDVDVFAR